jgi:hypothetical protein
VDHDDGGGPPADYKFPDGKPMKIGRFALGAGQARLGSDSDGFGFCSFEGDRRLRLNYYK